jgi:hypothetical protein
MTFTVLHSVCRNVRSLSFVMLRLYVLNLCSDSIILMIERMVSAEIAGQLRMECNRTVGSWC